MGVDEDRAERLRRLQERRGATPPRPVPAVPASAEPETSTVEEVAAPAVAVTGERSARSGRRRRHAAPAGRVLAAGISASAFLGGIAAIGSNPPTWASGAPSDDALAVAPASTTLPPPPTVPPVPSTVVIVEEVHHSVYVDQYGNPIAGSAVPPAARQVTTRSTGGGSGAGPAVGTPSAPSPAPAPAAPAPVVTPPPPPPACSGSTC